MKIETKEELKYIMQFHNIPFVNIVDDGHDMGKVTKEMKYVSGLWHYNAGFEHLAFTNAIKQVSEDYKEIETWKETSMKVFVTRLLYGEYSGEKRPVTGYCWESDVEECHIKMSKDENGNLLLHGRINDLENFKSYANDHMRYCRERYYFENKDLNHYIELFNRYGLKNANDDSYKWWRIGIVD